jgi:diadenylate cyclase
LTQPTTETEERGHALGPADAAVTLVEYGDYQCPYCAGARPVLEELVVRAGEKLRLVFRHYPLDSVHPLARRAAEAAEAAADQDRFWSMHGLLYDSQENLSDEDLRSYATRADLDLDRFDEDLADHRHAARIEGDRLQGRRDGVRGTPGIFLNGAAYNGPLEVEALLEAVEEAATNGSVEPPPETGRRVVGPDELFDRFEDPIGEICSEERGVNTSTLKKVVELAVEIAREGREGRKIGTLFVVGDTDAVLERSRPLILDPLAGHPDESKSVRDPDMRETIKELAQLDGAFVVSDGGVVVSAARYLDAASDNLDVPLGLGSRHMAAASISRQTGAVAVAVSESSTVRLFDEGAVVAEVVPEVWMLRGYGPYPGR